MIYLFFLNRILRYRLLFQSYLYGMIIKIEKRLFCKKNHRFFAKSSSKFLSLWPLDEETNLIFQLIIYRILINTILKTERLVWDSLKINDVIYTWLTRQLIVTLKTERTRELLESDIVSDRLSWMIYKENCNRIINT